MTLGEWLDGARDAITRARGEDYFSDAGWLLCGTVRLPYSALSRFKDQPLTEKERNMLDRMLERRVSGEPMQYILGTEGFMGLPFQVDSRVLIPRADTETLCDFALNAVKGRTDLEVLDLCTGSGALAVALAKRLPSARVCASDLSEDALAVARENAARHGVKVEFLQGDLLEPVDGRTFDLIVCNPPYLTKEDMDAVSEEVRREPSMALYGGPDGLDFYRRLAKEAPGRLKPGGLLAMEIGEGQAGSVEALFGGFLTGRVKDMSGIDRVVYGRRETDAEPRI